LPLGVQANGAAKALFPLKISANKELS
jgi:hypothetical protein